MGNSPVEDARKWLRQRTTVPSRVASLILRCAEGSMKPSRITMSTDMYIEMAKAAAKALGKEFDLDNVPAVLSILIGDHELKVTRDEGMPWASMHATR